MNQIWKINPVRNIRKHTSTGKKIQNTHRKISNHKHNVQQCKLTTIRCNKKIKQDKNKKMQESKYQTNPESAPSQQTDTQHKKTPNNSYTVIRHYFFMNTNRNHHR